MTPADEPTGGAAASSDEARGAEGERFCAQYYARHCGDRPYTRQDPRWRSFFASIADEIVRSLSPQKVFDAGCAMGMLVEALWDRGVEARGRDVSAYAIERVRPDMRGYCARGSVTDPIEGTYDLVVCIEVLEHLADADARRAVEQMTAVSEAVLFSSTPTDFDEPTHVNVRPPIHWIRLFRAQGFAPRLSYDASFVCPHALLFERHEGVVTDELARGAAELVLARVSLAEMRARLRDLADAHDAAARLEDELRATREELELERQVAAHARRVAEVERRNAAQDRSSADDARARAHAIETSPYWRASAPVRRAAGRVPPWARRALRRGVSLTRASLAGRAVGAPALGGAHGAAPQPPRRADRPGEQPAGAIWARKLEPLRVFRSPETDVSVNVVTDSIEAGYLYGGVGTALILGGVVAGRLGARLRVVTRHEPGDPARVARLLRLHGVSSVDIEVLYSGFDGGQDLAVTERDRFLTTSWWTTVSAVSALGYDKVAYLLQEDERNFYALGDEQLACSELLDDERVRVVVNSALLYRHLTEGPAPIKGLDARSVVFEPAFPTTVFYDDPAARANDRRTFLFYARPNNLRNLYWRGLEAIQRSLEAGVLDPAAWRFLFVGKDVPEPDLPGDPEHVIAQNLEWDQYAALVRSSHVGMSLIHSPHPSYPPLDLAASGATVVTNTFGQTKLDLSSYCANIVCVPPTVEEIARGIAAAVSLSEDETTRRANLAAATFPRDWSATLDDAVRTVVDWTR